MPDPAASRFSFGRFLLTVVLISLAVAALYFAVVLNWSYSSGERAGWVQKFSKKGWLCKTWEGEIALVSMPGAIPEKFVFTVTDDEVAAQINRHMGHRVSLHYEQKVGLPTSCFGETRYFVTRVVRVEDGTGGPGQAPAGTPGTPGMPGLPGPARTVPTPPPAGGASPAPGTSTTTPGLPSLPGLPSAPAPVTPAPADAAPAPSVPVPSAPAPTAPPSRP